jgi:hypothetical protein
MRPIAHLVAAVAAMTLLGADALAASVTCQSRNNQREECWLQGRGEVVLVRQISKTTCVKGRNWDETAQRPVRDRRLRRRVRDPRRLGQQPAWSGAGA